MKQAFNSATLRLTAWYILILFCISLLFSIMVYQISIGEIERRLTRYQDQSWTLIQPSPRISMSIPDRIRSAEIADSKRAVISMLVYINILVLGLGGSISYLFARRTLRPIEEAHEAQSRFVSDASHELRTPLTTMTTELEVALQDPSLKKEEMRSILASNLEEVQHLNKLSNTLLALSTGNRTSLPQEPFNIVSSVENVTKRFNEPLSRITIHTPKKTPQVIGNQASIEELLAILIENALKYSPSDSTITVIVSGQSHKLLLRVINSGQGISEEHLPHIFDRFYRADGARTGNNGYGLGLALARQISDIHGANLTAASTPNVSTEFSFSLPIFRKSKAKDKNTSI